MSEPRASLTDRLARGAMLSVRARSAPRACDVRIAMALTGAIALGPLLTIVGATLLRAEIETESRALDARLRARLAPESARADAAAVLRDAVRYPAMTVTLDRLAGALPGEARIVSVARDARGGLMFEISTTDPDALRSVLRDQPAFAGVRETGQRRTPDARLVVTLRSAG